MGVRVFMTPEPDTRPEAEGNGIQQVVHAMFKYLPQYGIEFVGNRDRADLYASHVDAPYGVPDVAHVHGLYPTGEMPMENWAYEINARVIQSSKAARVVTVPAPWVAEIYARNMGFYPRVVPHGIEPETWPEPTKRSKLIVLWNKNRPGDVCSVEPVERLAQLRPNVEFISTFGTPRRNMTVTGAMPHPQMQELLYKCGIYYAPTKETFGIGMLEAMAAGMPVVTWNWGNAPSLVRHMVDGYVAEPYDYFDTARGLDWCIEHFDDISPRARAHGLTYSWDEAMRAYAALYKSVVQRLDEVAAAPLVSVVIPCHNYSAYVTKAIQSVKEQTLTSWECTVVDDGSTDESVKVIRQEIQGDDRFKLVEQANAGVAEARNVGATKSSGRFLCFLDADDYLLPKGLETLSKALLAKPGAGIAYGKLQTLNQETGETHLEEWPPEFDIRKQMRQLDQVPSCCLVDSRAFFRAGGYRGHAIPAEDAELWSRIVLLGFEAFLATQEPVYTYRRHAESVTAKPYAQPAWNAWLPAANGGMQPIASVAPVAKKSHPVLNYDRPLVSFVTPVGPKHAKLVAHTIESVCAQLDPRWEHIVVDDTDEGQLEALGTIPYKLRYPHVRWLRNTKLHNVSAARNLGASQARGRFLCFLDADDVLFKEFVALTLPEALNRSQAMVYTDWIELPEGKTHASESWNYANLMSRALFAVTFLHERKGFIDVGGFDESLSVWEDWDYTVRLSLIGFQGVRVPQPLFSYNYATGTRREESLAEAQKLMQQEPKASIAPAKAPQALQELTALASKGARPSAIKRAEPLTPSSSPAPAIARAGAQLKPGQILVRYVGPPQQGGLFRTPNGRRYRFDHGSHQEGPVRQEDVGFFTGLKGLFEVVTS